LLVLAPAGFGKTTLVGQWADAAQRPVAWTTAGATDHDPVVLMSSILAALELADVGLAMPETVLTGDEPAFSRRVLPTFQRAIESIQRPVTLVVDDIHAMAGALPAVVLVAAVDSLPEGSRIALVGRTRPDLPVDLWRGRGRLTSVGPDELGFSRREVQEYLRWSLSRAPSIDETRGVHQVTTGWPVGVYLQAMSIARRGELATTASHEVHHYLDAEVLASMPAEIVEFLRRTSVLGTLNGGLCDHVLEETASTELLRRVEKVTLLVSHLDGRASWYRTHPLLRERLYESLLGEDPELVARMHSRAAAWYAERGCEDEAVAHAINGDDLDLLGDLVWEYGARSLMLGRSTTVQRWLSQIPTQVSARSPGVAITAAWSAAENADGPGVERWATTAGNSLGEGWLTRLDESSLEPGLALLVVLSGTLPTAEARDLAGAAAAALPAENWVRSLAFMVHGWLQVLCGSLDEGLAALEYAREVGDSVGIGTTSVEAPALMGYLHATRGDLKAAALMAEASRAAWIARDMEDSAPATALLFGIRSYVELMRGRSDSARAELSRTEPFTTELARAMPSVAVLVDAFSARSWAMLGDHETAQNALHRADRTRTLSPPSEWLDDVVSAARREVETRSPLGSLTPAELRVWHQLRTGKTIREVGEFLHVSPDTVKTHVSGIYRKFGVTSRRDALAMVEGIAGPS
jgi:LuxR family maltose regulon positive regulatory protein